MDSSAIAHLLFLSLLSPVPVLKYFTVSFTHPTHVLSSAVQSLLFHLSLFSRWCKAIAFPHCFPPFLYTMTTSSGPFLHTND